MPDPKREVERLIEDGLIRYGAGDLAGALAAWERALIQDPHNLQAVGYVDYVRRVVDLVTSPTRDELVAPFGLGHGDAPEYQIDLLPEPPDDHPILRTGALEDGWPISQDDDLDTVERLYSEPPGTLDLELDESDEARAVLAQSQRRTRDFGEIRTAEEAPIQDPLSDSVDLEAFDGPEQELSSGFLASVTPGFGGQQDSTPGFADDGQGNATGLRQPQLGFVQPRRPTTERAAKLPAEPPPRPLVATVARGRAPEQSQAAAAPRASAVSPSASSPSASSPSVNDRETLEVPDPADAYDNFEMAPFIEELPPTTEHEVPARPRPDTFTRNLGLAGRYVPRDDNPANKFGEESPTRELPRHGTEDEHTQAWRTPPAQAVKVDDLEALAAEIQPLIERGAPAEESREARLRRRISTLVELATKWSQVGEARKAAAAADLALAEEPDSATAQKLIHRNRDALTSIFQAYLGSLERRPALTRSFDELAQTALGARAAFLLSRIDGNLTFDEILDVSGMPRLEAYRYLCQLLMRGILSSE